jgi:hypothetical protein
MTSLYSRTNDDAFDIILLLLLILNKCKVGYIFDKKTRDMNKDYIRKKSKKKRKRKKKAKKK